MENVYVIASLSFIVFIMIMYLITSQLIISKQQRTIDRLTDKLMAKDYGEYKRLEKRTERQEEPKRKPLSYYDDNSIEVEDAH